MLLVLALSLVTLFAIVAAGRTCTTRRRRWLHELASVRQGALGDGGLDFADPALAGR